MKGCGTIVAAVFLLGAAPFCQAEDLLYVRTDNKLYTCNTQTGELAYITDGTLQWIASPSFDEPHHTALYVVPGEAINQEGSCYFGNPVTREAKGPYEVTLSALWPFDVRNPLRIPPMAAYATSTERLYTVGGGVDERRFTPVMIDQYAGPQVEGWGGEGVFPGAYEFMIATVIPYDPIRDAILAAWASDWTDAQAGRGESLHSTPTRDF